MAWYYHCVPVWVLRDADESLRGSHDRPSGARRLRLLNLRFLLERVLRQSEKLLFYHTYLQHVETFVLPFRRLRC